MQKHFTIIEEKILHFLSICDILMIYSWKLAEGFNNLINQGCGK